MSKYICKPSAAQYKIILCVLFHVNKFDQAWHNLISPFSCNTFFMTGVHFRFDRKTLKVIFKWYLRGGSIFNENPFITPSANALGFYSICQTKDQSVAVILVHETLFYFTKFNKLQTF